MGFTSKNKLKHVRFLPFFLKNLLTLSRQSKNLLSSMKKLISHLLNLLLFMWWYLSTINKKKILSSLVFFNLFCGSTKRNIFYRGPDRVQNCIDVTTDLNKIFSPIDIKKNEKNSTYGDQSWNLLWICTISILLITYFFLIYFFLLPFPWQNCLALRTWNKAGPPGQELELEINSISIFWTTNFQTNIV